MALVRVPPGGCPVRPNLIWQQLNGWPTLDLLRIHSAVIQSQGNGGSLLNFDSGGMFAFLAYQPLLIGPVTLPLWAVGWYYLVRERMYRILTVAALVAFVLFLLVGRAYYPGPLIPVLLAAGCVQLASIAARQMWSRVVPIAAALMIVQGLVTLPLTVPVVPESMLAQFGLDEFNKDVANTVGWPQLVAQVAGVHQQLPPDERDTTAIFASNYGEAGAIDLYGPAPRPSRLPPRAAGAVRPGEPKPAAHHRRRLSGQPRLTALTAASLGLSHC